MSPRVQVPGESKWEHVGSQELSKALQVGHPWLIWLGLPILAAVLHGLWPQWWAAAMVAAGCCGLAAGSAYLTHDRKGWHGRLMAPVSFAVMGTWLTWADLAGLQRLNSPQVGVWFIGFGTGCWYWSHWLHARSAAETGSIGHKLAKAFATVGHPAAKVIQLQPVDDEDGEGQEGTIEHPPGMTAAELAKVIPNVTAAAGLPPGAITTSPDMRHGGRSKLALSNPLLLEDIQPWPGPSQPAASITAPIRPARYSNGKAVKLTVVNHSVQVMGQTGSGKSFGWTWNEFAEQMTRHDAALMIADYTKDEQTVGPMRLGVHRTETSLDGIADMFGGVHRAVKARTRWLAGQGLNRWAEGCGLKHLTVGVEEAPDIVDLLSDEEIVKAWLSDIKAGRSAGIRWLISLQRSTFDQMPTIVRSQLAKICFGLESSDDADYGLSDRQKKRGCHPGDWGQNYPGKFYLDAPGIPDYLVTVEARTYAWGDAAKDGGKLGAQMMQAHAAAYPASARPLDEVTLEAMAAPARSPSSVPPASRPTAVPDLPEQEEETMRDDDPAARLEDDLENAGSGPDVDPGAGEWVFGDDEAAEPMDAEAAMACVRRKLADLRERRVMSFGLDEWADILTETGRSTAWLYSVMERLERDGEIKRKGTRPRTWQLGQAA